jgi:hypothetical protein
VSMVTIASLWLPILLSAVLVFVASFVLHMLVPFHRSDYRTLPNEDQVMDTLRQFAIPPGDYMAPSAGSPSAMRDPKFLEKMTRGPVVVSLLAALATSVAFEPGADHRDIVHFSALIAFIGYCVAMWQLSIWYRRSRATTLR